MVGTFAMGPVAGILIELVKILVHLVTKGTMTAGVGDVANFLFGCAYVVPAGLIYRFRHKKSRVHAVAGMAAGTVLTAILACFVNALYCFRLTVRRLECQSRPLSRWEAQYTAL